jgi:type I restriction enzyme S subunit
MTDLPHCTLDDVLELQRGHDLPATIRGSGNVPVIGSFGITGFHDVAKYAGPGVAIGRSGASIGVATYCASEYWPLNTCLFVKDFRGNDPRWVFYLLDSIDFSGFNSGSAVPSLNRNYLKGIPVVLPELAEQRAIAGLLGALDDKIETNRRLIRTLDELYMAECEFALDISSENVSLGKVASLSLGGTPSKENASFWEGGEIPWINSGRLHEFPVLTPSNFVTPEGLSRSATKLIPKGSTVVAITGATLGVVSRLAIDTAINQSIVAVECRGNVALNGFMLYALRANMAELVSSATGAAQQHVNKANFEELVISIPTAEGFGLLHDIPSLLGQVDVLAYENVTLSLMRNALLPELMSGRLRVKDAPSMMENV